MIKDELAKIIFDSKSCRTFGLSMALVASLVSAYLFYRNSLFFIYLMMIAFVFLIVSIIMPSLLLRPYKWWMVFSIFLNIIVTKLVLIIVFYTVILLIRALLAIIGKKFMKLNKDNSITYWQLRKNEDNNYERQF